jgi:hypothetical protein
MMRRRPNFKMAQEWGEFALHDGQTKVPAGFPSAGAWFVMTAKT